MVVKRIRTSLLLIITKKYHLENKIKVRVAEALCRVFREILHLICLKKALKLHNELKEQ